MDFGALDVATTQTASLVVLIGLLVLAVAVLLLLSRHLVKLVLIGVILVVGIAVYNQRAELASCPHMCSCSFLGYHLEIGSDPVAAACQDVLGRVRTAVS